MDAIGTWWMQNYTVWDIATRYHKIWTTIIFLPDLKLPISLQIIVHFIFVKSIKIFKRNE